MKAGGLGCAVGAVVVWSTNALAARAALVEMSVPQVLAFQFVGAAITLGLMLSIRPPRRRVTDRISGGSVLLGVVGIVGTISLQYLAFGFAPIVEANILAYAWPLFVAVWATAVRWCKDGAALLGMATVGFIGVGLIISDGRLLSFSAEFLVGYTCALASAACMAFYSLAAGRLRAEGPELLLPATLVGAALMLGVTVSDGASWPSLPDMMIATYIGVGPMAAGYFLWTRAMARGETPRLAVLGYSTPLLSTLLLIAAGERLGGAAIIGGLLVIGASTGSVLYRDRSAALPEGGNRGN